MIDMYPLYPNVDAVSSKGTSELGSFCLLCVANRAFDVVDVLLLQLIPIAGSAKLGSCDFLKLVEEFKENIYRSKISIRSNLTNSNHILTSCVCIKRSCSVANGSVAQFLKISISTGSPDMSTSSPSTLGFMTFD